MGAALFILPVVSSAAFDKDLFYGLQLDAQVSEMQELLIDEGVYSGPITGNFFSLTLKGVKNFQAKHSINQTGYFGPLSRAKANEILAAKGVTPSSVVSESGTPTSTPPTVISKNTNDTVTFVNALLEQVKILQQQITVLQSQQQAQTQAVQQQTQTLEQIQQNTVLTLQTPAVLAPEQVVRLGILDNDEQTETKTVNVYLDSMPPAEQKNISRYLLPWKARYATRCVASGNWNGEKPVEGSETVVLDRTQPQEYTFTLTCTNDFGSSVTRNVNISVLAR